MEKPSVVIIWLRGCADSPVRVVRLPAVVSWRLCAAGQVSPVVHNESGQSPQGISLARLQTPVHPH